MPPKTAQCFVLLLALLQVGEMQGEGENEAPNNSEGVLGECVRRDEFDQLKQELYFWQNTTIRILNRYLLEDQGGDQCSNEELRELHQKLDRVEVAGADHSTQVYQRLTQLDGRLDAIATLVSGSTPSSFPNGSFLNPVPSCKYIEQDSPSGHYWIQTSDGGYARLEYCDMSRECCGSRGGWMRVAHLNMTDPNQHCPPGFRLITSPRRMCGRPGNSGGCVSTTFQAQGIEYQKVCGQVIGYQYNSPNGFYPYDGNRQITVDGLYVDGISLTHGSSPRKHIWTFAAAIDETRSDTHVCPCTRPDLTYTGVVPPFIGQDYFCETGSRYTHQNSYYIHDPLWDGRGCGSRSTCCSFNNPPWFCKEFPQPTTDNIELRLCGDSSPADNEDTPIELVELYVQ